LIGDSAAIAWDAEQHHPARPTATAPAFVPSAGPFRPSQLVQGSRIALDGTALVAFLIATEATVLVTDHPALAQTGQHPVLSALRL
jgi:hypothetical protein